MNFSRKKKPDNLTNQGQEKVAKEPNHHREMGHVIPVKIFDAAYGKLLETNAKTKILLINSF